MYSYIYIHTHIHPHVNFPAGNQLRLIHLTYYISPGRLHLTGFTLLLPKHFKCVTFSITPFSGAFCLGNVQVYHKEKVEIKTEHSCWPVGQ